MFPSANARDESMVTSHSSKEQHYTSAFHLMTSCPSMVLHQSLQLGVFDIMSKAGGIDGRMSPSEIASLLPTSNPDAPIMLDRMLYLLATYDVLTCSVVADNGHDENDQKHIRKSRRRYGLTPISGCFVKNQDGLSLGPALHMGQEKIFVESWYNLKNAILEGGVAFDKANGMNAFEYAGKNPKFNEIFNEGMYNQSTIVTTEILETYKGFECLRNKCLVDVGGGLGHVISLITSTYADIKGINFDLPHVIDQSPVIPGVEHVGGDMFEKVPEGDAIFMKWILHDWSDERCLKVLRNCHDALPANSGKVIVVEMIIPEIPDNSRATQSMSHSDIFMMLVNPGGRERTKEEYVDLAREAGFSRVEFEHGFQNFWVMEFFK